MNSKELAHNWMEVVWNQKNAAAITDLLDENATGITEGASIRGPAEFVSQLYDPLVTAFPDLHVEIQGILAEADEAVVRWTITGTQQGPLLHLSHSGLRVQFSGMTWLKFREGKIIEGGDSFNLNALFGILSGGPESAKVKLI